jgi:hypothetical protein
MPAASLASSNPAPRTISAGELCRAVRDRSAIGEPWGIPGLDRVLRHDSGAGLLEIQAGVRWNALAGVEGAVHFRGTVGQSVAQNVPGPDGRPLVSHLRSLTLATADGQLRRASRERAADLFRLAVGGHGAFGPFYSLTLDLESLAAAHRSRAEPVEWAESCETAPGAHHAVELLVPPAGVEGALGRLREAVAERRFDLARLESRRASPEDVTLLRWARREYLALRVEFVARATLGASVAAAQLRTTLIDLALESGGSFMPGSLAWATRAQAEACFPMLGEFLAERRRLDPAERLCTPWVRDASRVWRGERCRVRFGDS